MYIFSAIYLAQYTFLRIADKLIVKMTIIKIWDICVT